MRLTQPTGRPNFHKLYIGDEIIYFSYETPIAYYGASDVVIVSENEWGPTTGKHINHIKSAHDEYLQVPHSDLMDHIRELF